MPPVYLKNWAFPKNLWPKYLELRDDSRNLNIFLQRPYISILLPCVSPPPCLFSDRVLLSLRLESNHDPLTSVCHVLGYRCVPKLLAIAFPSAALTHTPCRSSDSVNNSGALDGMIKKLETIITKYHLIIKTSNINSFYPQDIYIYKYPYMPSKAVFSTWTAICTSLLAQEFLLIQLFCCREWVFLHFTL